MVAGPPDPTASAGGPADQGEQPWRRAFHSLGVIVAVLAVYFAVPVGEEWSANAEAFAVAVLVVGMALLAWQIVRQVRRQITAGDDAGVRVLGLIASVITAQLRQRAVEMRDTRAVDDSGDST